MALSVMQAGQQLDWRSFEDQDADGEGANLNSADAVQLIAKTARLSISGFRAESIELSAPGNSGCSLIPRSHDARTCAATTGEWREDISAETSATVCRMSTNASNSSMIQTPSASRFPGENLNALGMDQTSHRLRTLSLAPYLHHARLRRTRALLPPLLTSPARPSLADLIRRSIVLTHTAFASRRLARKLTSIRLARQLARRPSAETLVERCVLPPECLPCSASKTKKGGGGGGAVVAPALVARKRAVERERVKDLLREWIGNVWKGEVVKREEGVRRREERAGVGRVWRLRRYWERVARGEV
ncbi:hypothetical protein N657DRAFT_564298 [Parathielavia appendiculata]|uniref:Uncharacterized protein n=1 Tax=Parathielavia appendiculata TaxID=2587402 RepID=A0AAN6Z818_9PEZI|nr:hypothetical protein N657DRAFT_564298 [Parathielavia appendiculata]